ncbi:MAG: helix-turn-helix domain-containing protein [Nocardioidaceae bacterium]
MGDPVVLGARVNDRRNSLGLSQRQLAGEEMSSSYVSLIESGKRWPTLDVLEVLARRLQTTSRALATGDEPEVSSREKLDLDMAWSKIALRAGSPESAEKYARAVVSDSHCSESERLDALQVIAAATEGQGRLDEAIDVLEPLVEELDSDVTRELWLSCQVMLCRCYRDAGDLDHAIGLGERALDRVGEVMADDEVMLAITLASVYTERGDFTRGDRLLRKILGRAEVAGSHRNQGAALWNASYLAEADGRLDDALRQAERALALFSESDAVRNLGRLRVTYANLLRLTSASSATDAREHLLRAQQEFEMEGTVIERARCLIELARCALDEDLVAEAEPLIAEAETVIEGGPEAEHANVDLTRGHMLVRVGDIGKGLRVAKDAACVLERADTPRHAARAWREVADLARSAGDDSLVAKALEHAVDVLGVRPTRVGRITQQNSSRASAAGETAGV